MAPYALRRRLPAIAAQLLSPAPIISRTLPPCLPPERAFSPGLLSKNRSHCASAIGCEATARNPQTLFPDTPSGDARSAESSPRTSRADFPAAGRTRAPPIPPEYFPPAQAVRPPRLPRSRETSRQTSSAGSCGFPAPQLHRGRFAERSRLTLKRHAHRLEIRLAHSPCPAPILFSTSDPSAL